VTRRGTSKSEDTKEKSGSKDPHLQILGGERRVVSLDLSRVEEGLRI